jgi:3-hydroxybutyryl-CoA dehydratase
MPKPDLLNWVDLIEGLSVDVPFSISHNDMQAFAELSGDHSRIHHDVEFALKNGFLAPVVYGALIVARLSALVGMRLPGDLGLATEWKINFNNPLYVNDQAVMRGEITHVSEVTHTIKLKFSVFVGDRIIATGLAGSKLLNY